MLHSKAKCGDVRNSKWFFSANKTLKGVVMWKWK